jgi:hypothetical protein
MAHQFLYATIKKGRKKDMTYLPWSVRWFQYSNPFFEKTKPASMNTSSPEHVQSFLRETFLEKSLHRQEIIWSVPWKSIYDVRLCFQSSSIRGFAFAKAADSHPKNKVNEFGFGVLPLQYGSHEDDLQCGGRIHTESSCLDRCVPVGHVVKRRKGLFPT